MLLRRFELLLVAAESRDALPLVEELLEDATVRCAVALKAERIIEPARGATDAQVQLLERWLDGDETTPGFELMQYLLETTTPKA